MNNQKKCPIEKLKPKTAALYVHIHLFRAPRCRSAVLFNLVWICRCNGGASPLTYVFAHFIRWKLIIIIVRKRWSLMNWVESLAYSLNLRLKLSYEKESTANFVKRKQRLPKCWSEVLRLIKKNKSISERVNDECKHWHD